MATLNCLFFLLVKTKKPVKKSAPKLEWSKPYCGLTHLGKFDPEGYRVTVVEWNHGAELKRYYPDCGFTSINSTHKNVATAKRAGERYMKKHT